MSDSLPAVRELLGLPRNQRLMECCRCGHMALTLLQLQVIGHQVALCSVCLHALLQLAVSRKGR
jgi:hypothetical protein